jgi:hypothetical protein
MNKAAMKKIILFAIPLLLTAASIAALTYAAPKDNDTTSLTIYSKTAPSAQPYDFIRPVPGMQVPGYAIVKSQRIIALPEADSAFTFNDIGTMVNPATVMLLSLTDPALKIIEQNYRYDTPSNDRLLERYIGQEITVEQPDKAAPLTGILLSKEGGITLQDKNGDIHMVSSYSSIRFPKPADPLVTKPALLWKVHTSKPGSHTMQISYQTAGLDWTAAYNMIFTEGKTANSGTIDLSAMVAIANQSGIAYNNAQVKLVSGEVNQIAPMQERMINAPMMAMKADMASATPEEKSFADYHLYTIPTPVSIADNSMKQVELFSTIHKIPAKRIYRFNGQFSPKVESLVEFQNEKKAGLGIPLPAGRLRAYMRDSDNAPEFIGEDILPATPKDEPVTIKLGNSADIVGKRTVLKRTEHNEQRQAEEEIEVTLSNHMDKEATVQVNETLNRSSIWTISGNSQAFEKKSADNVQFTVTLGKGESKTVRYTVKYTW